MTLNVAGSKASKEPEVGEFAPEILDEAFSSKTEAGQSRQKSKCHEKFYPAAAITIAGDQPRGEVGRTLIMPRPVPELAREAR
jgi:hypothetical protein